MSRLELMAAIALATGMTLTVAKIASSDGEGMSIAEFAPADFLSWASGDLLASAEQAVAEDELQDAY